jgi:hypothetical protein
MATPILTDALRTNLGSPVMGGDVGLPAPTKRIAPSPEEDLARADREIESTLKQRSDLTEQLGKAVTAKSEYDLKEKAFAAEQQSEAAKKSKTLLDDLESKFANSPEYKEYKSNADKTAEELTFKPSQENAQTLALVFSVISASGFLLGGLNKKNALSAMYAMNGLTQGYAKGREDLFKQERQTFETNVKAMQDRMKVLKDKLDVGIKTLARDKERGELEIQAAMAEANADFLKSQKDARGVIATRELLENQIKQLDKSLDFLKKSEEKYRAQQLQGYWNQTRLDTQERLAAATNERLAQQFATSQRAADERAAAAERRFQQSQEAAESRFTRGQEARETKVEKLSATKEKKIDGLNSITSGLDKLKKDFKPEYAGLGVFGLGADLELEAARRGLGKKEANDAARWWGRYNQYQAPNRHALFGATLTGNELKNYLSFTAKPSDSAQTVRGFIDDQLNYSKDILDLTAPAGYKPKAKPEDYESTFGAPSPAPQPSPAQPSTGPYIDPDKERRYQDWKSRQPK